MYYDVRLWRKSIYDKRRKSTPMTPKSLDESKTQLFNKLENH